MWFVESLRSSMSLGPTLTLVLCETFARNRVGDHPTVSVRHGNSARPPSSATFCNVRLVGEPIVHVTVREASGFVMTIGASERARGTAARRSMRTSAPRNIRTTTVLVVGLGLRVSMGIPVGPPCSRPRPFTFIRGGGYPFGERDRKSTRLNSSHGYISYAVFCLKKKKKKQQKTKKY